MTICEDHVLIKAKVEDLEEITKVHTLEIAKLREQKSENKILFETIQDQIKEIKEILQDRASRLPTLAYSIIGMIIGGTITGVVLWVCSKISIL